MKGDAGDVAGMAIEGENSVWICRLDVVEFDSMVAGSS
jgi:hypothetical protein